MNIYRIEEVGETSFWKATNSQSAIDLARKEWLDNEEDDRGELYEATEACREYEVEVFQACVLVGELKN